jgi:predicted DNA-binding transcriptional regulator AlpA
VKCYSTAQVAKLVKIGRATLHRWMREGYAPRPKPQRVGGVSVRMWSVADVECVRRYKLENYRKGRGRKPKPKR